MLLELTQGPLSSHSKINTLKLNGIWKRFSKLPKTVTPLITTSNRDVSALKGWVARGLTSTNHYLVENGQHNFTLNSLSSSSHQ